MNTRRKALKHIASGIALLASTNGLANGKAAAEITVYYSPD